MMPGTPKDAAAGGGAMLNVSYPSYCCQLQTPTVAHLSPARELAAQARPAGRARGGKLVERDGLQALALRRVVQARRGARAHLRLALVEARQASRLFGGVAVRVRVHVGVVRPAWPGIVEWRWRVLVRMLYTRRARRAHYVSPLAAVRLTRGGAVVLGRWGEDVVGAHGARALATDARCGRHAALYHDRRGLAPRRRTHRDLLLDGPAIACARARGLLVALAEAEGRTHNKPDVVVRRAG
jgi:hypothetical protein